MKLVVWVNLIAFFVFANIQKYLFVSWVAMTQVTVFVFYTKNVPLAKSVFSAAKARMRFATLLSIFWRIF